LLGNNGKYLKVDSVELVEARPSTAGGETFEEFGHLLVVQTIGTVEHNTLTGQGLGEIFDSLCLTSASWSFWGTTIIEEESTAKSSVATICQGRDYQAS